MKATIKAPRAISVRFAAVGQVAIAMRSSLRPIVVTFAPVIVRGGGGATGTGRAITLSGRAITLGGRAILLGA